MPCICVRFAPNMGRNRVPDCSCMTVRWSNGLLPMCSLHLGGEFCDSGWLVPRMGRAQPIALEALERIGRLYKIEEEIRGRPPDERQAVRQARAGPELESMHEWLHKTATTLSKKSELAKAIRYALSNWVALTRYRDDGRLEADNNAAERALRAVALGRKNWLFAGSDDGGERTAAIYTLIGTANLNDLNPESYLRYVLERIADHPINRIDELLPWNLVAKMPSADRRLALMDIRNSIPILKTLF